MTDPVRYPTDAELRGYDRAQSFAKHCAAEITQRVRVGMSERDVYDTASQVFREHDIRHHWHMPVIGVGPGSTKFTSPARFARYLFGQQTRRLHDGDVVFLDIAPFFEGFPSDVTVTELYGEHPGLRTMIDQMLAITRHISLHLREDMDAGETWRWINDYVRQTCTYELRQFPICPIAHRFVKPPDRWPRFREIGTVHLFTLDAPILLERARTTMRGLWVVEPLLVDRTLDRAAKTEDVVFVAGEETYVFGEAPFTG